MANANYQHPIAQLLDRLLVPNEQGGYDLNADNAALLEAAILERAHDPKLNGGLLALFGVAEALHHRYGSLEAAGTLLAVLGRAGRLLFELPDPRGDVSDLLERVASKRTEIAPHLDAVAPKGSVPASSFNQVQRARMGVPPSRRS